MRAALFLAAFAALQVSSAFAQNTLPACDGDIAVVRISAIKPGAMPGFLAAVAAKKDAAWDAYVKQYRDTSDIKNSYLTCMPKLVP